MNVISWLMLNSFEVVMDSALSTLLLFMLLLCLVLFFLLLLLLLLLLQIHVNVQTFSVYYNLCYSPRHWPVLDSLCSPTLSPILGLLLLLI